MFVVHGFRHCPKGTLASFGSDSHALMVADGQARMRFVDYWCTLLGHGRGSFQDSGCQCTEQVSGARLAPSVLED